MLVRVYAVAACAVAPLLAAEVWSGFRLAFSDPIRSVIAATEQPLSIRGPGGSWALGLALVWFSLAYWQRRMSPWEPGLVALGGAAALVRLGNEWLFALAILVPLARQLSTLRLPTRALAGAGAACLAVAALTVATTRPPALPTGAAQAALAAVPSEKGTVFADWYWAGELQQLLGSEHRVLPGGGIAAETSEFWLDYVRIAEGHERWAEVLQNHDVDLLVLDAAGEMRPAADQVRTSPDWRIVYDADGALVAQRSSP